MDCSIIIPSYNTKALLDRCLSSVFESIQTHEDAFEIIVVDNASDDGSVELVKKKYPKVKLITNKKNVGYGKANNEAIKLATGTYILLLNSDTVVLGDALSKLLEFSRKHPRDFAGAKLLNEDKSPQTSCGWFYSLPVVFAVLFLKGDSLAITRWSPNRVIPVDWVSGACLIGAKTSFLDIGMFDEGIFMYMEEVELLYRAKKKGYTCLFYPEAQFIHTGAASSGSRKEPVLNIYRGLLYFYRKHRSIMEQKILIVLLKTKAYLAKQLGNIVGDAYLKTTYEQALSLDY